MPLILRVDVDKPYGRSNMLQKVLSKTREDLWFPAINMIGYLSTSEALLDYCNQNDIRGIFYFRNCTSPNSKIKGLMAKGNHAFGFHAENTRTTETFQSELSSMKKSVPNGMLHSFTKHGSGKLKLGKNHYPPYEPEKYKEWVQTMGVPFYFGNEVVEEIDDFSPVDGFYPKMFWLKKEYRIESFATIEDVISAAKTETVPIIIHPANFVADTFVNSELKRLVDLSKENNIDWITEMS